MSQDHISKLQTATREKLRKFNSLRGREVRPGEFWDVVVVTAVDGSQKEAYELQIREKVARRELPLGAHYLVVSDPPGSKIGNGGSTLCAVKQLNEIYGKALSELRIVLIHAGGFSQRLPSASALGKIFMALPLGEPIYQMLELKLAMYVDFPSQMKPGILVTCADDIELYSIGKEERVRFDKPGFTALAHPSSLSVGTTHGVFVLDPREKCSYLEMENTSCLCFLHKPSVSKMRGSGAVCKQQSGLFSVSDSEFVYTDSTYYVDFDTAESLLNLLTELGPLSCEIDAYGDFLQALGPKATVEYTNNTTNVTKEESNLVEIRQKIFHLLRGTPLNVILLNNSKFYHVGTTSEYLFHLTEDEVLRTELGLLSSAFSVNMSEDSSGSCIMYSILDPSCSVGAGSVVEYSRLGAGVSVGGGSIISSCWIGPGESVPAGVFMHSVCVNHQEQTGFVTIFFGIKDNLKHSVHAPAFMEELRFFGFTLSKCLSFWEMDNESLRFSGGSCSLWNVCMFPVCCDQRSSFSVSLKMLQAILGGSTSLPPENTKFMSMQECLESKNLDEMLELRRRLRDDITQMKLNI
ncbi:fucose-1-phosphate guanylyltransferase [Nothobranchius furzeri]|uniref:Fucose-1-phosphate guanylyltransferase n=3 Tax=Nothobranchius TaxID=28779 RepID=A0A1A7Z8H8_NOTFU|nr:fucose-1-phosphate guanylyltransferase [Nothobranchius furzeri]KAF7203104.1 fucose-1-phosphate guanylyltransferase [Nothobranchius furzeri]